MENEVHWSPMTSSAGTQDGRYGLLAGAVLALLSLALHLLPFLFYGTHPLGYDTGFYRRYLIQPFISFPSAPVPGLGEDAILPRLLLDVLRLTNIPTDVALYGAYLLPFILLPVLLFVYLAPRLGTLGAFFAGLFLILSSVGYTAYWYFLFKNAWGLCLILLALAAYERKRLWLFFLSGAAVALTHKTSAIMYLFTLGVLWLIGSGRRRELAFHILLVAAIFVIANLHFAVTIVGRSPQAVFLGWREFILLSYPFILLALVGICALRSRPMPRSLVAFALASFAFPIFFLPFYERIFIFCDVALAALAAYGALHLLSRTRRKDGGIGWLALAALCIAVGLAGGNLYTEVRALGPSIAQADLASIFSVTAAIPPDATVLTTSEEAPWYEGWGLSHVAAPGMLADNHDLQEWIAFWSSTSTPEKVAFLDSLPKPLYVSTLGDFEALLGVYPPCITPVRAHLLFYDCLSP